MFSLINCSVPLQSTCGQEAPGMKLLHYFEHINLFVNLTPELRSTAVTNISFNILSAAIKIKFKYCSNRIKNNTAQTKTSWHFTFVKTNMSQDLFDYK